MNFLQSMWSDSAGRIFLITFTSYLFGYMVYGGYLFAFFGRKGSLPIGLADFSIADLISIFPEAIITIIDIIPKVFLEILKSFFINFAIPLIIGVVIRSSTGFRLGLLSLDVTWIGSLAIFGIILWLTSYLFSVLRAFNFGWFVFVLIEVLGAILFFSSIPNPGESIPVFPVPTTQTQQGINNLLWIILILEAVAVPYTFGVGIARTAIKSHLLIKINRLTLRQPIISNGMRKIAVPPETKSKNSLQELWLAQKNLPINIEPDAFEWLPTQERDVYLIATFEKFVVFYEHVLDGQETHTIMLNRDLILSIEFANRASSTKTQD